MSRDYRKSLLHYEEVIAFLNEDFRIRKFFHHRECRTGLLYANDSIVGCREEKCANRRLTSN